MAMVHMNHNAICLTNFLSTFFLKAKKIKNMNFSTFIFSHAKAEAGSAALSMVIMILYECTLDFNIFFILIFRLQNYILCMQNEAGHTEAEKIFPLGPVNGFEFLGCRTTYFACKMRLVTLKLKKSSLLVLSMDLKGLTLFLSFIHLVMLILFVFREILVEY
jgi:hypothetical protein